MEVLKEADNFRKSLLVLTMVFSILSAVLTWYGIGRLGFVETDVGTRNFINLFGLEWGLVFGEVLLFLFYGGSWSLWIISEKRIKNHRINFSTLPSAIGLVFFGVSFFFFFWSYLLDFSQNMILVFYRSEVLQPILNYRIPLLVSILSTIFYLSYRKKRGIFKTE